MYPDVLWRIRLFGLTWELGPWRAAALAGFVIAALIPLFRRVDRRLVLPHWLPILFLVVIGGYWGSVFSKRLLYPSDEHGTHFFGWAFSAGLLVFLYAKLRGLSVPRLLDSILPGVLLGSASGRIGCFFAGCCHGFACSPPFGVQMPGATQGPGTYFPAQLVNAAWDVGSFLFVYFFVRRTSRFAGQAAIASIVLYAVGRFGVEFARVEPKAIGFLTWPQVFSLIAIGLAYILYRGASKAADPTSPSTGAPPQPLATTETQGG